MKPIGIALVGAMALFNWIAAAGAVENPQDPPRILVDATGEVTAKPDLAVLQLVITTTDNRLQRAFTKNTETSNAVVTALKQNGLKAEDIQTLSYRVTPIYEAKRKPVRYSVVHQLSAKVRNFEALGPLLDELVDEEVTAVQQISFQVENPYPLEQNARIKAAKLAREKANDLAVNAGAKLGRALRISENTAWAQPMGMARQDMYRTMGGVEAMAAAPQLEPGEIKFSVTCHAEYALE